VPHGLCWTDSGYLAEQKRFSHFASVFALEMEQIDVL
jgi:hypothetical protein